MSEQDARTAQTLRLYRQMPGAPRIPTQGGYEMTGDVEGNDHWNFCAAIVDLVMTASVGAGLAAVRLIADKENPEE